MRAAAFRIWLVLEPTKVLSDAAVTTEEMGAEDAAAETWVAEVLTVPLDTTFAAPFRSRR
jgi:hypothetical protein